MAASDDWELYYWPLAGRGEFVRLMFEEAGVKFKDTDDRQVVTAVKQDQNGFPVFAPPVLRNGDFRFSQTPIICKYLGKKLGMYPEKEEDEWHAEQVNATIHDFIADGRLAFHGIHPTMSYYNQIEETKPYIERFIKERLPLFLKHLEAVLKYNNGGNGFVIGDKITYVDLALLHFLRATESQFTDAWTKADYIPKLKDFKNRMSARPRLAAYFKSDRCRKFEGNSMM